MITIQCWCLSKNLLSILRTWLFVNTMIIMLWLHLKSILGISSKYIKSFQKQLVIINSTLTKCKKPKPNHSELSSMTAKDNSMGANGAQTNLSTSIVGTYKKINRIKFWLKVIQMILKIMIAFFAFMETQTSKFARTFNKKMTTSNTLKRLCKDKTIYWLNKQKMKSNTLKKKNSMASFVLILFFNYKKLELKHFSLKTAQLKIADMFKLMNITLKN